MPFPTVVTGRVDTMLTNISLAIVNQEFIHDKILPVVPNLIAETGLIGAYADDTNLRIFESIRSIDDEGEHRIEYKQTNDTSYRIDFHDLEKRIPDRVAAQFQKPFDANRDALTILENLRDLSMENALATVLADATVLTNTSTPSTLWDDPTSDPLGDMETAAEAIRAKKGVRPNKCWTNSVVIGKLKGHPQIKEQITGGGVLTTPSTEKVIAIIKEYLNVDEVHVGKAIKATSKEGQALTKGEVWSDDFGLYYAPNSPSLMTPSFGYRFEINGVKKRVTRRRDKNDQGNMQRLEWAYQDKILDVDSCYLLDQVIT